MKNYNYYDDYNDNNDYYDDYYNEYPGISFEKRKKNKKQISKSHLEEDNLFSSKSGKKKKKDYKKLQKEKEKMKIDAVNSLFSDDEDEE